MLKRTVMVLGGFFCLIAAISAFAAVMSAGEVTPNPPLAESAGWLVGSATGNVSDHGLGEQSQTQTSNSSDDEDDDADEDDDSDGDCVCPCPETCGGVEGTECEAGQYCERPEGECSEIAEGECAVVPGACPSTFDPVCGCDGRTYSNACTAAGAGVTVAAPGPCAEAQLCGGASGATCQDDHYCRRPIGLCEETDQGVCWPTPGPCPSNFDPVCGCDGITYANACSAASTGINVAALGACETAQACGGGNPACGEGQFCQRPEGECAIGTEGVCQDVPGACPSILAPVCGCDGETYDNACLAAGAGVTVEAQGPCILMSVCGGTAGECAAGQYCAHPVGECDPQAQGICRHTPLLCSPFIAEVCGCDGKTYPSACVAAALGVTVAQDGPCLDPVKAKTSKRGRVR